MDNGDRPNVKIKLSFKDKIFLTIATICVIIMWLYLYVSWSSIPSIVPTHFGLSGEPDDFGDKVSLFILPAIAVILHIFLSVISRIPKYYNYPIKVTEENAEALYIIGKETIYLLDLEISFLFLILLYVSIQTALGFMNGLGGIGFVFIAVIIGTVIYETVRMFKLRV